MAYCTIEPGAIRPVDCSASAAISTRGPRISGAATRSGSEISAPRIVKLALPRRTVSPTRRFRRSRTTGSASRPWLDSAAAISLGLPPSPRPPPARGGGGSVASSLPLPLRERVGGRGRCGRSATAASPTSGQAASTTFSSTNCRSPDGATSMDRICTTSDSAAPRARSQSRNATGKGCEPLSTSRSPPKMRLPSSASPRSVAARSEPTAAMTATPSARHNKTTQRPRTPPRSSRRARRKASIR